MELWRSLPVEIRLMIFDYLKSIFDPGTRNHSRAGYASVCSEWRSIFEPENFRYLVLDFDRLFKLDKIMVGKNKHRQAYVRVLHLRIRLDEYDCDTCESAEDGETILRNSGNLTTTLWNLTSVLTRWKASNRPSKMPLVLDLAVYSPSDCKHAFKDFRLDENYPFIFGADIPPDYSTYYDRYLNMKETNDHGWSNGMQSTPSLGAKKRVLGTQPLDLNFIDFMGGDRRFPMAEVVTGITIRRQFYRKVSLSLLSKLLQESFTRLRELRLEWWRGVETELQQQFETNLAEFICSSLPKSLAWISLFQDFNQFLHPSPSTSSQDSRIALGKALAKVSRLRWRVAASFVIDAQDFFSEFWPEPGVEQRFPEPGRWKRLQVLALTSNLLSPHKKPSKVAALLAAAGVAASGMPKLQTMEIWNAGVDYRCIFRYSSNQKTSEIVWRGTWELGRELLDNVYSVWVITVHQIMPPRALTMRRDPMPERMHGTRLRRHAGVIPCLQLRRDVTCRISEYQMYWEVIHPGRG